MAPHTDSAMMMCLSGYWLYRCGEGGMKGVCGGVAGEVWGSVYVHVFKSVCECVCGFTCMIMKTENFQIACNKLRKLY